MKKLCRSYIDSKQRSAYLSVMLYDRDYGEKMDLFITTKFSHKEGSPSDASYAMHRLVSDKFSRWFRYQSTRASRLGDGAFGPVIYTWVAEAKSGRHFHWCLHMPEELRLDFEKRLPKWISDVVGPITDEGGYINIREIYGIMGAARYCMKGINPIHAGRRHIRPEKQGTVYGKRVAISRSLSKKARGKTYAFKKT